MSQVDLSGSRALRDAKARIRHFVVIEVERAPAVGGGSSPSVTGRPRHMGPVDPPKRVHTIIPRLPRRERLGDIGRSVRCRNAFSGVVWVDRGGDVQLAKAYGPAPRDHGVANAVDTQFGIASGTKGLTALTMGSLIEEGRLEMTTTARSVLRKICR